MSDETTTLPNTTQLTNYEDAKDEILSSEKINFENKFNQKLNGQFKNQKNEIDSILKKYVDYSAYENSVLDFSDSNEKNQIEEKLNKLSYNKKIKILNECARNNTYSIGYLILPQIESEFKSNKKSFLVFEKWTDIALKNSNDRYLLPKDERESINKITKKYIDSKRFSLSKFDDIAALIQKSGSEYMLETYKSLLEVAICDYKKQTKNPKNTNKIEQAKNNFNTRFEKCILEIRKFIENQINTKSYTWYLNMKVSDLEKIFKTANDANSDVLKENEISINAFLVELLVYYIETTRNIINSGVSLNQAEKWELDSVFQFIGGKISNQNLKLQIFYNYMEMSNSQENSKLYLPLDLLKESLFDNKTNVDATTKKIFIDNLKNLESSSDVKMQIEDIIKDTILKSNDVNIKNYAINKFKNEVILNPNYNVELINNFSVEAEIRYKIFAANLEEKNEQEKSSFIRTGNISIFDGYLNILNEEDLPFLKKSVDEFVVNKNNNLLPLADKFHLILSFLKNAPKKYPVDENRGVYQDCCDFILENKNSESCKNLKNQIIEILSADKISGDLRANTLKGLL